MKYLFYLIKLFQMDATHGTPGRFVHSSLFSSPRHPVHSKENNPISVKSIVTNVLKKAVKNKTMKVSCLNINKYIIFLENSQRLFY